MPRHGAGPNSHHFARRRRRLRAQGNSAAGRSLPFLADDASRPSGALDRGSPRASHRQLQLPRAPLQDHRLCRSRRPAARHRLRSDRRFRRLLVLSVLGVPGGGAGRQHPARTLFDAGLSLPDVFGRDQQVSDPALSRRGPHRRLLRAGTDARSGRGGGRAGARRSAPAQSGAARADAVRQHHQQALRQRRLSRGDAARACVDRRRRRARTSAQGRGRRAPDRRRRLDLLRAGRARDLGLFRLGHSDGARPRTGLRAPDAGRRPRTAGRRAFAWAGHGNDAGAGRA